MQIGMFSYHKEIEIRMKVYSLLMRSKQHFRDRFNLDPLSLLIVNNVNRFHKLETLFLALTLLRYKDVLSLNKAEFISGDLQIITQGKTKEPIEIPPLFLSQITSPGKTFPPFTLYTEGYDKLRYALKCSIPCWLREQINSQKTVTHIFRFLRASYMFIKYKDFYLASKYLGHKDPESIKSYVPPELINLYSQYLSKG